MQDTRDLSPIEGVYMRIERLSDTHSRQFVWGGRAFACRRILLLHGFRLDNERRMWLRHTNQAADKEAAALRRLLLHLRFTRERYHRKQAHKTAAAGYADTPPSTHQQQAAGGSATGRGTWQRAAPRDGCVCRQLTWWFTDP